VLIAAIMLGTVLFLRGRPVRHPRAVCRVARQAAKPTKGQQSGKGGEVMPEEATEIADKQAIFLRRSTQAYADLKR